MRANLYDSIGKLPPQAVDLEETVIGALLMEPGNPVCKSIIEILQPEHFYKETHRVIATGLLALHHDGIKADIKLLTHHLRKTGQIELVGGAYALAEITTKLSSSENIEHHYRIIIEMWMRREIINMAWTMSESAYDDSADVFTIVDAAAAGLQKINPYTPEPE